MEWWGYVTIVIEEWANYFGINLSYEGDTFCKNYKSLWFFYVILFCLSSKKKVYFLRIKTNAQMAQSSSSSSAFFISAVMDHRASWMLLTIFTCR